MFLLCKSKLGCKIVGYVCSLLFARRYYRLAATIFHSVTLWPVCGSVCVFVGRGCSENEAETQFGCTAAALVYTITESVHSLCQTLYIFRRTLLRYVRLIT